MYRACYRLGDMSLPIVPSSLAKAQQAPFPSPAVAGPKQLQVQRIAVLLPHSIPSQGRTHRIKRARTARTAIASYSSDGFGAVGRPCFGGSYTRINKAEGLFKTCRKIDRKPRHHHFGRYQIFERISVMSS